MMAPRLESHRCPGSKVLDGLTVLNLKSSVLLANQYRHWYSGVQVANSDTTIAPVASSQGIFVSGT